LPAFFLEFIHNALNIPILAPTMLSHFVTNHTMKKALIFSSICMSLLVSCKNDNSKVEELEKKVEQQNAEMQNMKESMLEKELEEKNKEIDELKSEQAQKKSEKQSDSGNSSNYYAQGFGKYPLASNRLLTYNDVANLPKSELTIMRNEIFARHGYIFKTQEMIQYFSRQNWYRPLYSDVYGSLSEIEKTNINYIKSFE